MILRRAGKKCFQRAFKNCAVFNSRFQVEQSKPSCIQKRHHSIPGNSPSWNNFLSRADVNRLFEELGSTREVKEYLKKFGSADHFAIIKVGGGCLQTDLDVLIKTLGFMQNIGLTPVVVHGAGPQINEKIESLGIEPEYIEGQRVTSPEVISIVRDVLFEENRKLVSALEEQGTRARPLIDGVFTAEQKQEGGLGLVGDISAVNVSFVEAAAKDGCIPVLTCLASTKAGNALNVNADFAAIELAKAMKPLKVVWVSNKGGIAKENGEMMDLIDLSTDFDMLMSQPWFKHGDRLKLRLMKDLLNELPRSSSISITSAENLSKELFTHRGAGTMICRQERIQQLKEIKDVDMHRLKDLIEDAFQGKLASEYFDRVRNEVSAVYVTENYNGAAILLKCEETGMDYLDKFAVRSLSQSDGLGARLMKILKKNHSSLWWRSRKKNPINSWYYNASDITHQIPGSSWTIFAYGEACLPHLKKISDLAKNKVGDIIREGGSQDFTQPTKEPVFLPQQKKIGLIGARGYTGNELCKIIDHHDFFKLGCLGSRKYEGRRACDVMETVSEIRCVNITPEHMVDKSQDIDAWILALPNGLAKPYVDAIPSEIPIIDLSADYRWDAIYSPLENMEHYWQYGLPERPGYRERITKANKVANPGCYASAMQLGLIPFMEELLTQRPRVKIVGSPHCFGISGYSGAGTTPSDKNNPEFLANNIIPYALTEHGHELEVSHQFSNVSPHGIYFTPHVAEYFRGINMTISLNYDPEYGIPSESDLFDLFSSYYEYEPFVDVTKNIPMVRDIASRDHCIIGGFKVNPQRNQIVFVSVLDNLLKGAASVCGQNLNLMFGLDETLGLDLKTTEVN